MSHSSGHNITSFNTNFTLNLSNDNTVTERSSVLAWLSPLDPNQRHQDTQDRRVENIGEWLLQTEEFRSWHASSTADKFDNAVLFCYGDLGVGKTHIR